MVTLITGKTKDRGTERQLGVIAQEVEKVFPEAVLTNNNGFKAVAYDRLVAPVLSAMKQLYAKLTGVDARVAKLEKENAELKARLADIDTRLSKVEQSTGRAMASVLPYAPKK